MPTRRVPSNATASPRVVTASGSTEPAASASSQPQEPPIILARPPPGLEPAQHTHASQCTDMDKAPQSAPHREVYVSDSPTRPPASEQPTEQRPPRTVCLSEHLPASPPNRLPRDRSSTCEPWEQREHRRSQHNDATQGPEQRTWQRGWQREWQGTASWTWRENDGENDRQWQWAPRQWGDRWQDTNYAWPKGRYQ